MYTWFSLHCRNLQFRVTLSFWLFTPKILNASISIAHQSGYPMGSLQIQSKLLLSSALETILVEVVITSWIVSTDAYTSRLCFFPCYVTMYFPYMSYPTQNANNCKCTHLATLKFQLLKWLIRLNNNSLIIVFCYVSSLISMLYLVQPALAKLMSAMPTATPIHTILLHE